MQKLPPIERRSDGSLPRMTPRQKQAAVKLISNLCSNFDNGDCLLHDDICPQSITYSVNCRFFRWVLLEDKDGLKLKSELFRDDSMKKCSVCGNVYQSKSNNAKYCDDCSVGVQRKQKAAHARKRRSKVEK